MWAISKFRHTWSGAQATEVHFISKIMPQGALAGQLGTDWTKNCETHPKQFARNIIIDTLLIVFFKKK